MSSSRAKELRKFREREGNFRKFRITICLNYVIRDISVTTQAFGCLTLLQTRKVRLKCDGTRWRTGGEVNWKLANGVCSQYSSHYLKTWCIQHYYRWCAHLGWPVVDWTDAPRRFKWTRLFRRETKSGFCACDITFQLASTSTAV